MMIFGYMIGIVLFGVLYVAGMKIMSYIDPEPPKVPDDKETEYSNISTIHAFEKSYRCIKTITIRKTYGYDADQNVLEFECKYIKFQLDTEYSSITDNGKVTVYGVDKEPIECYLTRDCKCLVSYNPITSERIYKYRKSWKNKALSA